MEPLNDADPRQVGGFTLTARLGASTGGTVFLGESAAGRRVVVKVLPTSYATDPPARARFAQEVEISRRLTGLFTPEVVDADVDGPLPWMATRFIEGRSVYGEVTASGPLDLPGVLDVATGTAEALEAVHAAGLVHRDVKPSHVVLSRDGAHLIGFVVAAPPGASSLTPDGLIVGTLEYIAPELLQGEPATAAADVFSLGGVLYFAATGEAPFGSGDPAALIHRITTGSPELDRIADPGLRRLLAACFDRDPARRPTAEDLVALTVAAARASQTPPQEPALHVPAVPFPVELMPQGAAPPHVASSLYTVPPAANEEPAAPEDGPADTDTYRPPPSALRRVLSRRRLLLGAGSVVVLGGVGAGGYEALRPRPSALDAKLARSFEVHYGRAVGVGASPDGTRVVTATSSGQILFWDVATAKVTASLSDGIMRFTAFAVNADLTLGAVGDVAGVLRIVDLTNRKVVHRVQAHKRPVNVVAMAPKGDFVVTAPDFGEVAAAVVWDAAGVQRASLVPAGFAETARAIAVSADGATVATSSAKQVVTLWDPTTGTAKGSFRDPLQRSPSVAFSPDGTTLATTRNDDTLVYWDAATLKETGSVENVEPASALRVVYLPSGRAAVVIGFTQAFVQAPRGFAVRLGGSSGQITGMAVTRDSRTAVGSSADGDTRVWNVEDGRNTAILKALPGGVRALAFSPSGNSFFSGGDDARLRAFDVRSGASLLDHPYQFSDSVHAIAVTSASPGRVATSVTAAGAVDGGLTSLYLYREGNLDDASQTPGVSPGNALAFSPDGKLLAVAGGTLDQGAVIVDGVTGQKVRTLVGQGGTVTDLAFSPDGKLLVVATASGSARLWNVADGTVSHDLAGHTGAVLAVAYAPDGATVATAGQDSTVRLWDAASGGLHRTVTLHRSAVIALAVSPDSRLIASASDDGTALVWTASDGEIVSRLTGHRGAVTALAFRPKATGQLASGGQDGTVRLWTLPQ